MKRNLFTALFIGLLFACSTDDTRVDNPNLLNVNVNLKVRLSLPQYDGLNFPSNPVLIPNYGNGGIVIMNTGGTYVAWDAADPNHPRSENCSSMQIDGLRLECPCEENSYDIFTGNFVNGDDLKYLLYSYRVEELANGVLSVTN